MKKALNLGGKKPGFGAFLFCYFQRRDTMAVSRIELFSGGSRQPKNPQKLSSLHAPAEIGERLLLLGQCGASGSSFFSEIIMVESR